MSDVFKMKAGSRFVEYIKGLAGILLAQLGTQLHALGFAAAEGYSRLSQRNITQTHFLQDLDLAVDVGDILEELYGFFDGHVQDVADGFTFVANFEGLPIIAFAIAFFAVDVYIGKKGHFYHPHAAGFTDITTATFDVEGKPACVVAPDLCFRYRGEEGANVGEESAIGGWITARGAADGRLVDLDDLVYIFQAFDSFEFKGSHPRIIGVFADNGIECPFNNPTLPPALTPHHSHHLS